MKIKMAAITILLLGLLGGLLARGTHAVQMDIKALDSLLVHTRAIKRNNQTPKRGRIKADGSAHSQGCNDWKCSQLFPYASQRQWRQSPAHLLA